MTITYGPQATGWVNRPTLFFDDITNDIIEIVGAINFNEMSNFNTVIRPISNKLEELKELAQAVYNTGVPDLTNDVLLENAYSLIAVSKLEPRKSTATVTLTNDTASPATIPALSVVKQSSNNTLWNTLIEVEIPANGTIDVNVESQEYGAFTSPIGSIDTIVTIIAGWSEVTNEAEGQLVRGEETDPDFRQRKETAVTISKGGVINATRNYIYDNVSGVTFCNVTENNTDVVVDGLAPHSIKVVVVGGTDQDIWNAILTSNGNGINTNGDVVGDAVDSVGNLQTMKFYRATIKDYYVTVNLTVNGNYLTESDDVIKDLILAYADTLNEGEDILRWAISTQINPTIEGIENVDVRLGFSPSPTGTSNLSILANEKSRLLLSNIVIVR